MRLADALRRLPGSGILLSLLARTGAARMFWRYRHLIDGSYRQAPPATDVLDPHRERLWSLIAPFSPQSLLDVGCGDGANLALFARKAPAVRLDGVDLNPLALAITRRRIIDGGGTLGTLQRGSADKLPVATASVDVALSDAVFMYLPPAQAVAALKEMRRTARRAAIVHTFADDEAPASAIVNGSWVHAFGVLVQRAIPGAAVKRYSSALVIDPQWKQHGAVFVVTW